LVRELLDERKLMEMGPADNPLGRKQVLLRLNEEYGFVVGVDFDAESVVTAVMDLRPRIRNIVKERTYLGGGIDGLVQQLLSCTSRAIEQAGLQQSSIVGIGIVDPGLINSLEGVSVISSTIDFWRQVPLKRIFEEHFGVPAALENSSQPKALAERVLGAGKTADDMIYIEYGAGIGAGIIMGGKVLAGQRGSVGELGHTHVARNGPACKCGSFGCLEALAGALAVETRIREALQAGSNSRALALAGGDPNKITVWNVLEAARMDDKTCRTIVEEMGMYLGLSLANLVNLLNPSLIVLDKRLELAGSVLLDQLMRTIKRQALTYLTDHLDVRFGELEGEVGILGAGLVVLEKLFEVPTLVPPAFMFEESPEPILTTSASID
jgi:predicted NBD/HSP70 family sugar kinase